jgi:hypothetical protein
MLPWFSVLTLAGRLLVETGSPDALCPDLASAEAAIRARLGELEAGGSANWRLRYTIGHAPGATSGDFVRLELYDPQGELRLSRDLPLAGESCATVARVMALVVDRFFRAMVAEQATEAGVTLSASMDAPAEAAFETPTRARARPAHSLTAQAGILASPFSPTLGLAFTRRTPYRFSLSLGLTWIMSPATEALEAGAQATSRSALFRLSPAWDIGLGSVELALGPTLALGGERGTTTGLPESDVKYRPLAAAGALACLRFPLDENLSLDLSGGGEAPFRPFGGDFVVDGERVLEPAEVRGFLAIGVGPAW